MKKALVLIALVVLGCEMPTETATTTPEVEQDYRYEYEFKNDRRDDVVLVYCREFSITRSTTDSKGKGYYVDSTLTTFDTVFVPVDSIVSVGSDNDTLIMSPAYLLNIVDGRFRAIEYGSGLRKLSNDEY